SAAFLFISPCSFARPRHSRQLASALACCGLLLRQTCLERAVALLGLQVSGLHRPPAYAQSCALRLLMHAYSDAEGPLLRIVHESNRHVRQLRGELALGEDALLPVVDR